MGYVHPDKWSPEQWREHYPDVRRMRRAGWRVFHRCPSCGARGEMNLAQIELELGPEVCLWDRRPKCRTMLCRDRIRLTALPPHVSRPFRLSRDPAPERPAPRARRPELDIGAPWTAAYLLAVERKLFLRCQQCGRRGEVDLLALQLAGRGDAELTSLGFRCSECGSRRFNGEVE